MKIVISGTHGLIAGHLLPRLQAEGHDVVALVRGPAGPGEVSWDPSRGVLEGRDLQGVDAAIHLAGVPIFGRWNEDHKRAVLDSRVQGTQLLASRLAGLDPTPRVFLSASAIGFYGDRGDEVLDERSASGDGFLAQVCREWEAAAAPAVDAGIRTVFLRTGIVLAADGGSLKTQLPLFKFGLGGRLGSGKQWTSWITIDDEVGAIVHALTDDELHGPVNLTAPSPVTNRQFTKALGAVLHRPTPLVIPAFAVKAALSPEMAHEMVLGGQRVLPQALEHRGYTFAHRDLAAGLSAVLGR